MKYEDVKVGDKFFYAETVGISRWHTKYFAREFFIECEVERVTKTQFVTNSGRYKKDGRTIGRESKEIFKAGDKYRWLKDVTIPDSCQSVEALAYGQELKPIAKEAFSEISTRKILDMDLEKAKEAAKLMKQLRELLTNKPL